MLNPNQKLMNGQQNFKLSTLGLSVSILAASTLSFFMSPIAVQAQKSVTLPKVATVKKMVVGDLACYVDLVDSKGRKYNSLFADFEICEKKTFLNKKVQLFYQKGKINDCQSIEPCGKTKTVVLIKKMQFVR